MALLLALLLVSTVPVAAAPFSTLYFFGDSLSDAGNIHNLTLGSYPASPYYAGRFSNGPVWADYFAYGMGMPQTSQAYGMSLGPNFGNLEIAGDGGNNFAIGGARNYFGGAIDNLGVPTGVLWQAQYYYFESGGVLDPNALYVLFGGGNDLRDASRLAPAARDEAATLAAVYLAYTTYTLEQMGARNFLVLNAPDIGNTPESRLVLNNESAATAATLVYNSTLQGYITNFRSFLSRSNFYYVDTYTLFEQLYADALNGGPLFGFTNAAIPCFPGFAGSTGANCATSLFADDIHPTTGVHALLAQAAYNTVNPPALFSARFAEPAVENPEPSTIGLCLAGLAFLTWKRRRRA